MSLRSHTFIFDSIAEADEAAIGKCFDELRPVLVGRIINHLRCAEEIAEEIFLQAFMIVVKKVRSGDLTAESLHVPLVAYTWGIIRNLSRSFFAEKKANALKVPLHEEGTESSWRNLVVSEPAPLETMERKSLVALGLKSIGRQCRQLLLKLFNHKLSTIELSDQLGIRRETISRRKKKCLTKLRLQFGLLGIHSLEDI